MSDKTGAKAYLIRGGRIYDHDGDVHQPAIADLLIRGETIERIAPTISPSDGVEIVDAAGKLVIPGLINAHYHSHDVLAKGLFEEMPYDIWTLYTNPGNYGRRSLEEVRLRTLIGASEALRNGITTIQDMLTIVPREDGYVDTVLSAYQEAGIRVVFSLMVRDVPALDIAAFVPGGLPDGIVKAVAGDNRSAKGELDFIVGQMQRRGARPGPNQSWALGPSAPQRCSPELLEGIAALSKERALPVLTHVYETRMQAASARKTFAQHGGSLLGILDKAGLMNERLGIVHGVWLSPEETARLADAGARVVHNPVSNLKLKSGAAPILDLHRAGVDVALGCDNCTCGDTQNIFHAMRMLCLLPAVTDPEPGPITAAYALKAATSSGARVVGLDGEVGALKAGMKADLAILDLNEPAFVPFNSAARQIVFGECGRAVETVFVSGRPVVRDRKLTTIDEAAIAAEIGEHAPAFRRDAAALVSRNKDLIAPILNANRAAWRIPLGFDRYIAGRREP